MPVEYPLNASRSVNKITCSVTSLARLVLANFEPCNTCLRNQYTRGSARNLLSLQVDYMFTNIFIINKSCKRCLKANFKCPGYQDYADLIFRQYQGTDIGHSTARPTRQQLESQNYCPVLRESLLQKTYHGIEIEQRALSTFFDDYCVVSNDRSLSRGYLNDLECLLASAGPSSDITKAVRITSFASLGNKIGEPYLLHQANMIYSELLCSFQITMSRESTSNTIESLTTAVLLGIFEVC